MRVLQVINSLHIGGAEKLLVESVPLYQQQNIEMDVLVLQDIKTPFYEILEKQSQGRIIGLTSKSVYNPFLILKIVPYLKLYDVIHIHLFPALYWVVIAKLLAFSKIKLVYTEHNTHNKRRGHFIFKVIDSFIYSKLDSIIAITKGVEAELVRHLITSKEVSIVNNGINLESFTIKKADFFSYFPENTFKIIQVSSFTAQKDQQTLIKSLKYLPKNVSLLLVGAGPLLDVHKKIVKELHLSERVVFLGNRSDVPQLMNYADVVVLSSHWEGFGLAILEGMASRKPAIVGNIDGVREIVEGYGLLFDQGNAESLAKVIYSILEDSNYYDEISEKCYQRAKAFDINYMVNQYITLYKNLQKKSHS